MGQTRPFQHRQPWRAQKGRWTGSRTGTGASPGVGASPAPSPPHTAGAAGREAPAGQAGGRAGELGRPRLSSMRWLNRAQSTEQVGAGPRGSERPMASGTADAEAPGGHGVGEAGAQGGGSGHPEAPRPTPGRWGAQAARLGGWHRAGQEPRGAAWSRGAEWAQSPGAAPELGLAGSGGDAGGCKRRWSGPAGAVTELVCGKCIVRGARGAASAHTTILSAPPA